MELLNLILSDYYRVWPQMKRRPFMELSRSLDNAIEREIWAMVMGKEAISSVRWMKHVSVRL